MSETISSSTFQCTQCGGELHPDEGQQFLTCPYCGSTVYLDKSKVVFHWYLAPTLNEEESGRALARWMAGNDTVKDLDKKSRVTSQAFHYFPLWYFKRKDPRGKETIHLEPAAATAVSEVRNMQLPGGDLRQYTPDLDSQAHPPTVPLDAALEWLLENEGVPREEIAESAIVHIPLYTFKYTFQGRSYTALIEAASGKALANIFPAKSETPFKIVGGLAAATYLILAALPVFGGMLGEDGFASGMALYISLGVPAAVILFVLAFWVSQKV